MKRWKMITVSLVSIVFFAVNIYLIIKDDSKIAHSIFATDWVKVKQDNVVETFETKGVTSSAEEYEVYFNGTNNEFERFLVKEGDEVTQGTSLYEYGVKNVDEQMASLKDEISMVEGELTGIDDYIQNLTDYQNEASTNKSDAASLEQDIYKQEFEENRLEEKKRKLESQLTALTEQSGTLTKDSDVDGIVKNINSSLGNPVMTIASTEQSIKGILSESEYRKTEVGMEVKITSSRLAKPMKGTISRVDHYPTKEPALDKESLFSFQVTIDLDKANLQSEDEPLVIGSKVNVTVITNEAMDVPTVPMNTVHGKNHPYVFKMTKKGFVNKEYITTGLKADHKVELSEGPAKGEVVLVEPATLPKNHSMFITPIQTNKVNFSAYDKLTTREKCRFFLIGMLEK